MILTRGRWKSRAEKAEAEVADMHRRLADAERTIVECVDRWQKREKERDELRAVLLDFTPSGQERRRRARYEEPEGRPDED